MRTIKKCFSFLMIAATLLLAASCEKPDIKGEVITISNVTLSLKSNQGRVSIPSEDTNYTKTVGDITIPVDVQFSDPVPNRFNVNVSVDNDTINKLIAENKLSNTDRKSTRLNSSHMSISYAVFC